MWLLLDTNTFSAILAEMLLLNKHHVFGSHQRNTGLVLYNNLGVGCCSFLANIMYTALNWSWSERFFFFFVAMIAWEYSYWLNLNWISLCHFYDLWLIVTVNWSSLVLPFVDWMFLYIIVRIESFSQTILVSFYLCQTIVYYYSSLQMKRSSEEESLVVVYTQTHAVVYALTIKIYSTLG